MTCLANVIIGLANNLTVVHSSVTGFCHNLTYIAKNLCNMPVKPEVAWTCLASYGDWPSPPNCNSMVIPLAACLGFSMFSAIVMTILWCRKPKLETHENYIPY